MAYKRKTKTVYHLLVFYDPSNGWEHELTEDTRAEAKQRRKEYRENCPQYPCKIVRKRERIEPDEDYVSETNTDSKGYDQDGPIPR